MNYFVGNTLLHLNLENGELDWRIPGVYPSNPAYHDGILYIANEQPIQLEGREENSGDLVWYWPAPHSKDGRFLSEVLLTGNLVFVSTKMGTYAVDLETARTVWSYPATGRLALSRNGILYIQSVTRTVAINVK